VNKAGTITELSRANNKPVTCILGISTAMGISKRTDQVSVSGRVSLGLSFVLG